MQEAEVILVDNITPSAFKQVVENAINYAAISSAFTINRMSIPNLQQRIFNIAKGKIAEGLFQLFAEQKNLGIDFDSCSTPFYQADKKDFIWKNLAWDIKNNFIYHDGNSINNYTSLPGLIPNRSQYDQWEKKAQKSFSSTIGSAFLFTFLKLGNKQSPTSFFEINLSSAQENLLQRAYYKYKGKAQQELPFVAATFFDHFQFSKSNYEILEQPTLVITGIATEMEFPLFRNINMENTDVFDDFKMNWIKHGNFNYNFLDGTLYGKIQNAGIPIALLPSFGGLL
jgi:hypothetical protein